MSAVPDNEDKFERRAYPRFKVQCPVHYLSQDGGSWNNAVLEDYSAGGLCFYSEEVVVQDSKITIQITREAHSSVPPMAASAIVVRCELEDGTRFKVACKLTRVRNEEKKPHHYLRR
jgi:hypothetical protein